MPDILRFVCRADGVKVIVYISMADVCAADGSVAVGVEVDALET